VDGTTNTVIFAEQYQQCGTNGATVWGFSGAVSLPTAMAVPPLTKHLRKKGEPVLETVAIQGIGVFETLKELAKLVLAELRKSG